MPPDDDRSPCLYCDGAHPIERCPRIAAIGYDEHQQIVRVEFWPPKVAETPPPPDDYPKKTGG